MPVVMMLAVPVMLMGHYYGRNTFSGSALPLTMALHIAFKVYDNALSGTTKYLKSNVACHNGLTM